MIKHIEPSFSFKKPTIFWIFLSFLAILFILTFSTLRDVQLWGDESLRAMIAKNTLVKGIPTHWGGIRYTVGVDESLFSKLFPGQYVEVSSWLQYYIMAGFYAIFGESTFTSRLPFWLSGFAIFGLLYKYRYLFPKSDTVFKIVGSLLLLNVTFLVYTQQANYYIVALLLTLLSSFIFMDILKSKEQVSIKKLFLLGVVNFLLAHNHIPTAVTIIIVQSIYFFIKFISHWQHNKSDIIKVGVFTVTSGLLLFSALRLYSSSNVLQPGKMFWSSIVVFITQLNFYILPAIGFFILLYLVIKYKKDLQGKIWISYIGMLTVIHILLLSYFNYVGAMPFRYISSYMVLWFIGLALIFISIPKKWVITLFTIIILSNFYSGIAKAFTSFIVPRSIYEMVKKDMPTIPIISSAPIRCFYCEYIGGLFVHRSHPLENVILALNQINVENKKIIVGPCEGNTIMFYTKGIVIDQMPKKLYESVYKKPFEIQDAEVIVNNSFCPSRELDHDKLLKLGYLFQPIRLTQSAFINDGELSQRAPFTYPFEPIAIIYYKSQ